MNEEIRAKKNLHYLKISVLIGLVGAVGLLFLAFYIFLVFNKVSTIISTQGLATYVYLLSTLTGASALILIYGSFTILRNNWKGSIFNIVAGTVIPFPTYVYFAFLSEPRLLVEWLATLGFFILLLSPISGVLSFLLLRDELNLQSNKNKK